MIGEQEVPQSVSSDWEFVRVKTFYHVVGLSYEGFEDQMLAHFRRLKNFFHVVGLL